MATIIENTHEHRAGNGMTEERSLLLTFLFFAIIVAISALAVLGLVADDGTGTLTSLTESAGAALTLGV